MGYTHYWRQDKQLDKKKFAQAAKDCKKVTEWLKAPIQYECDNPKPPAFTNTLIRFNGIEDEGHETFLISQTFTHQFLRGTSPDENGKYFSFCKTAAKEYDSAVTSCLIVLKYHLEDSIIVSSDGNDDDWQTALNACKECLGFGKIPVRPRWPGSRQD